MIKIFNTNPWIIIILALAFSCTNKKDEHTHYEAHTERHPENSKEFHAQLHEEMNHEELNGMDVLSAYYALKNAFVQSDQKQLKSMTKQLISVLKNEGDKPDLIPMTEAILTMDNIENQRKAFEKLSEAVYTLAKDSEFGDGTTIYKQYCPMAFGNKGAFWLSESKEIMNPYFGNKMLHCGKVVETIALK